MGRAAEERQVMHDSRMSHQTRQEYARFQLRRFWTVEGLLDTCLACISRYAATWAAMKKRLPRIAAPRFASSSGDATSRATSG